MTNTGPGPVREGLPHPRGATWDGKEGVNFALFSAQCDKGRAVPVRDRARRKSPASSCRNTPTRSGTATCRGSRPGAIYGYRVHGPYEPKPAIASIPTSCCSTPMRAAISATSNGTPPSSATRWRAATTSPSTSATARRLCRNASSSIPNFDWRGQPGRHAVPWDSTVIYETHLRGFTKLHPAMKEELRGTYKGIARKR